MRKPLKKTDVWLFTMEEVWEFLLHDENTKSILIDRDIQDIDEFIVRLESFYVGIKIKNNKHVIEKVEDEKIEDLVDRFSPKRLKQ